MSKAAAVATACMLLVATATATATLARDAKFPSVIRLRNGLGIDTQRDPQWQAAPHPAGRFRALSVSDRLQSSAKHSFLVQVRSPEHADQHAILPLLPSGEQLLGYLSNGAYLVRATHQTASELQGLDFVNWVGVLPPEAKLGPGLGDEDPQERRRRAIREGGRNGLNPRTGYGDRETSSSNETVKDFPSEFLPPKKETVATEGPNKMLNVRLHEEFKTMEQVGEYAQSLEQLWNSEKGSSIQVIPKTLHSLDVRSRAEDVTLNELALWLAEHSEVLSVNIKRTFKPNNEWARGLTQNDITSALDYENEIGILSWDNGLTGEGQIVGVVDSGLDYRSCYFADTESTTPAQPPFKTWGVYGTVDKSDMTSSSDLNRRKVVQYVHSARDGDCVANMDDENDLLEGHGTHVAGSVAGYPVDSSDYRVRAESGMATSAKIAFFDVGNATYEGLCIPDDLNENVFPWAYAAGARIHSNSWGYGWNGYTGEYDNRGLYFPESREVDLFMYNNKDFLILFAAGNDGDCLDDMSVSAPATNKNGLTVGASMNNPLGTGLRSDFTVDTLAYFSGKGPTYDFRLKPEVFGPGFNIVSMNNGQTSGASCDFSDSNRLKTLAGTSMATPIIAGHIAIARQYFVDGFFPTGVPNSNHGFTPSGALLKNIAINSAKDMTKNSYSTACNGVAAANSLSSVHPWIDQGYGRVVLGNTLYVDGNERKLHIPSLTVGNDEVFFDRAISTGTSHTYTYCVRPNTEETVVSLVWTDYPGLDYTDKQLVNDLDLTVETSSKTYIGNGGSSDYLQYVVETLDSIDELLLYGYSSTSDLVDRVNNYEVVYIPAVSTNTDITITVYGYLIPSGPQPYSLVVSGVVSEGSCSESSTASQPDPWIDSAQIITKDVTISSTPQVVPGSLLEESSSSAVNAVPNLFAVIAFLSVAFLFLMN